MTIVDAKDVLPDIRDGLTRQERIVLYCLNEIQREHNNREQTTVFREYSSLTPIIAFLRIKNELEAFHAKKEDRYCYELDGIFPHLYRGLHDDLFGYEELGRAHHQ